MRKRPLRAGGCTAATAIRRACRPRALRVCGSTTARQARAAQSDAAASKSSRASSAAATDGDPLVRVPADAFVPSNRRAWRCAPAQPGQRRRPWTWSLFLLNTSRRTWRRKEWFQRAVVSVFVKPVPRPASKQGTSLDLKEFAANQNISDPPLAGSPTCAVKHKMPHAARGRLNANAGPSTHMLSSTRTARTRVLSVRATNTQPCVRPTRARGVLVKPSKIACAAVDATGGTCPCPLLSLSVTRRGGRTPTLDERRAHALRAFRG